MFKKFFPKLNLAQGIKQNTIFSRNFNKYFSQTYASGKIDNYPDQFIERLKSTKFTEESWTQFEADVLEKIHFFDSDQYVDLVILSTRTNRGTELFWDQLSRKIFDYDLDLAQSVYLGQALQSNSKIPHFILDPIFRNLMTANVKWYGTGIFKKLI